jgi:hypothetical protein
LSVGARPHYIIFIPIFFLIIIWIKYKKTRNVHEILFSALIFLIPCLTYGIVLALYNYLRFDSIFEFGIKYQANNHHMNTFMPSIKDFIVGLKNNFMLLPNINEYTFFSLTKAYGHRMGNEYITGFLWTCPMIAILIFLPDFLKKTYKENSNTFIFLSTMIFIIVINIIIASIFGMVIRYIFEFSSLMIIVSLIIFLFYISTMEDRTVKIFLNILFVLIFIFSIFINTSLLFCRENFWTHDSLKNTNYTEIVNFLF